MITKLKLHNFKCFEDLELKLGNLNVLAGLNGMGKSTVLQSILLLAQSTDSVEKNQTVMLNGKYQSLGVGSDVLYENADEDEIGICYATENREYSYQLEYSAKDEQLSLSTNENHRPFENSNLIYLSAQRIAPQQLYKITDKKILDRRAFDKQGEYTIQYLAEFGNDLAIENSSILLNPEKEGSRFLVNQAEYWMSMISPGVGPVIHLDDSSRTAELKFRYKKGSDITNDYKSLNVGFGITYVLPIIVTMLTARAGDIILLENPEAHIHPKGQRILGEMIAAASASGAQIILETHSDHILNGIRLAVNKRRIPCDTVNLYYFYLETKNNDKMYTHQVKNPLMDDEGMLSEWPEGFFDEWDNALTELLM